MNVEGTQYIQHRVVDGTYFATLHWRINESVVEINQNGAWIPTDIKVNFIRDAEIQSV